MTHIDDPILRALVQRLNAGASLDFVEVLPRLRKSKPKKLTGQPSMTVERALVLLDRLTPEQRVALEERL